MGVDGAGANNQPFGYLVINASLAWYLTRPATSCKYGLLDQSGLNLLNSAVQTARSRNVVVVASAANCNTNQAAYPAALNGVLGVGATDPYGYRVVPPRYTWGSNWGRPNVDVSAPGEAIYTTAPGGTYIGTFNGTSAAAPLVSGIAMLTRSRYPGESEGQIRARIQRGSWNPEMRCWNCYSNNYGFGVVNAYYAVR